MGIRLLILTAGIQEYTPGNQIDPQGRSYIDDLPVKLEERIPDIHVDVCHTVESAKDVIGEADVAFGVIVPELFAMAKKLKLILSPQAGPKAGYYHRALIESDVIVTNASGIYSDHIGAHIMAFVLAFSRGLQGYISQQIRGEWKPGLPTVHLPEATAVIVGVGGIGGETARLCAAFGIKVIGIDARRTEALDGVTELYRPDVLADVLPRGDFVIATVPETPETQGMFGRDQFGLMKATAFFINIGRGATVELDALNEALRNGQIAGAGLDVFQVEPLPVGHPLWTAPGMLVTPHVAADGPYLDERREELFLDNCARFVEGRPLRNVVDKARWF
jgi:phosphoglycerate dehydrogenase-like enzyme